MSKVIEISFGSTKNILKVPVLQQGRIFSMTGYQKGDGNCTSNSPCFFCVCSNDTWIEELKMPRGEGPPKNALKKTELIEKFKPVMFRHRDKAKAVADAWIKRREKE